jgi:hypothetical protein
VRAAVVQPILSLALAVFAAGCGGWVTCGRDTAAASAADAALRERDTALIRDIDALTTRCAPAWRTDPACVTRVCQLRAREVELFALARAHSFTDLTESNYWHRGRLKFPGDLEQLLRRLTEDPSSNAPPCAPDGTVGVPPARR